MDSILRLLNKNITHRSSKGTVYLSPLLNGRDEDKRGIKRNFYRIKADIPVPSFLYLIQRL
jgi:hypothetical protein